MKKSCFLLSFVFLICFSNLTVQAQKSEAFTHKVKEEDVAATLKYLSSDELEGRETGTAGIEKAAVFLELFLKNNNIKPYFTSYRDTLSNFDAPAYNIVGFLEGTDPVLKNEFVVLSAHYDHIGLEKNKQGDLINNGANDDASGVTAVAEMAKYFSQTKSNKRSILFAFFAGEEKGLLGSKSLVQKLKAKNFNLYAQLNIEMIGVPMKRDYLAYITGFDKSNMAGKINEYTGKKTIGFLPKEAEYELFYRSDNFSFYDVFKKPCQSISTFDFENFEFYHHVSDDFKAMDIPHMTHFIQELLPAITQMATTPTEEITMTK
ncbi:M20/M25/M40 family metallo-hydrolase [Flavobacterium sp. Fl-77]|uniref:M20/M25/M40 family metallo-hydrolase n=1 Tax=Flavobacterium flavipigmentatum TaxID=2893884 RepID=A0AAJ2SGE8_9FLAO|nr:MULTISPECIES: M20/M25/M40 family metallo-hydrolase [unclassified Flavobacterium]MDX6182086.1 M20/M25/M40 family metallo-hydrolase [Flavobacterium sp. Fl-33]MDX6186001.1 M20/M25/M40 family metallo-hydrolase [Flavobacterium sp. Fl-77]UFH39176.1 M20/M25/M40 family metallo-hydrolase [Flavobacterium sp. F-70]